MSTFESLNFSACSIEEPKKIKIRKEVEYAPPQPVIYEAVKENSINESNKDSDREKKRKRSKRKDVTPDGFKNFEKKESRRNSRNDKGIGKPPIHKKKK